MKVAVLVFALCMIPQWLWADQVTITWFSVNNATSYNVYQSTDNGATFTKVQTTLTNQAIVIVPATGLVLFRISAMNGSTEVTRKDAGVWYDGSFRDGVQDTTIQ